MIKSKKIAALVRVTRVTAIAAALAGSGAAALAQSGVPPTADELKRMPLSGKSELDLKLAEERDLRSKAQREAAHSFGARSGLLRRSYEIRQSLDKMAGQLDAIYNFNALMLTDFQPGESATDGRARLVVPPVIVESGRTFNQEDSFLIRQRDKVLRIDSNAHFAPVAPNWRKYLVRDLGETQATLPHASLLPRIPEERANWDKWVAEGFAAGVEQASAIFEADQARLSRDFEGMIRYHELVEQKVVSLPFVATRNDGVTGDGNQLNINDVTLRITVMPAFQTDPKGWSATGAAAAAKHK